MKTKNQRLMKFSKNIDVTEAKGEHKFYFAFSKKYITGKNVLNIGSWTGPYESIAHTYAKKMTAVDIEERALSVLKKNLPDVICIQAFSHKLPFPDSSFDVVCFWDVIEHIPQGFELATILEINRVMRERGYFFLATPHANILSKLFDPAYFLAGHRHYSDTSLQSMFEGAGFKVKKILHTGSFFSSFYAIAFYFFKHILRMKLPNIKWVEDKMEKDISSPGYIQVVIRSQKLPK